MKSKLKELRELIFKCEEVEKAKYKFDGHTPKDVLERLKQL